MNTVASAAGVVGSEVRAAGKEGDPEWLAGAAMIYVQARVRPWREAERIEAGLGFTPYPEILATESGYCGSCVLVWRGILAAHGVETRQIGLMWETPMHEGPVGHVCAEARWGRGWHFFDVMTGTVWHDGEILPWERVRLNPDEAALRISNATSNRYTAYEDWFAADPFAYVHVEPLKIDYLTTFP